MYAKSNYIRLIPVMLCFFVMGFVDLVGIASNYVQKDLSLSDSEANLFPSLVFFWFLIFSIPTGMMMNRIGRKKTVLVSLIVTAVSLFLPLFGNGYILMLCSFSLLGIGNAIMQTSLNPLLSTLVTGDKLASSLTFGQFIKAIASFLAPYLATWGATGCFSAFGLDWRVLFLVYLVIAASSILLLTITPIIEEEHVGRASTFSQCFSLLGKPFLLLCFLGIMCHVGIDVGTNTTAPKILMERLGMNLQDAAFSTSLYFIFRTAGCFIGAAVLNRVKSRNFFAFSVVLMVLAMLLMLFSNDKYILYVAIAAVGFGNSNIFSIIFASALQYLPQFKNEISGLMIMGLFGGTVFPLTMGFVSDVFGQVGAVSVMSAGVLYLVFYIFRLPKANVTKNMSY